MLNKLNFSAFFSRSILQTSVAKTKNMMFVFGVRKILILDQSFQKNYFQALDASKTSLFGVMVIMQLLKCAIFISLT